MGHIFVISVTYFIGVAKLAALTGDNFFVISQYYVAGLTISAFTHTAVTLLIAGKIWWAVHRNQEIYHGQAVYMPVFWTVIESGALYSTSAIILVVLGALKTQAGGLFVDMFVQLSVCDSPVFYTNLY